MSPDFAKYCYSPGQTIVLALDIAKRETGYAAVAIPATPSGQPNTDRLQFLEWGRLKTDVRNDKMMFLVAQEIAGFIEQYVVTARQNGYNVAVIIEHPVFGRSRSEQQYLLFQLALATCAEHAVNVTTVTPHFLKFFIKQQTENAQAFIADSNAAAVKAHDARNAERVASGKKAFKPKKVKKTRFGLTLEKSHIKQIYDTITALRHPDWPRPDQIANDDEYDAIYLGALGALVCGDLPDLQLPLLEWNINKTETVADLYAFPWAQKSLLKDNVAFAPPTLRSYANLHWPAEGLKEVQKNFRKNSHRRPLGKLDYLFNQLTLAQMIYARHVQIDPEAAKALSKTWGSKRTVLDQDKSSYLNINYAGQFYCHHVARTTRSVSPEATQAA